MIIGKESVYFKQIKGSKLNFLFHLSILSITKRKGYDNRN